MSEEYGEVRRFGLPKARQAALDRLAQAYTDDDIELSDYEQRTAAVHSAENLDELRRIMHDVPGFEVAPPAPHPGEGRPEHLPVTRPPEADMRTAVQLLGDRAYGTADARDGLRIVSLLGDTTVDLRDLRAGERVVLSHIGLLGDLTLVVPRSCRIRRQHLLLLGDESRREPRKKDRKRLGIAENMPPLDRNDYREEESSTPPPELELHGFKLLGDVTVITV